MRAGQELQHGPGGRSGRSGLEERRPPEAGTAPGELGNEQDRILACVHCGFCLDACPTYTRLQDEADSPRGRLYLIRALAEARLASDSAAVRTHLDRCLGCRACEPVCPSGVQYGHLLERARATIHHRTGISPLDRLLLLVFGSRILNAIVGGAGRLLRAAGAAAVLARLIPRRWARIRFALLMLDATRPRPIPALTQRVTSEQEHRHDNKAEPPDVQVLHDDTASAVPDRLRFAMLEGCVQKTLFGHVNRATDHVLRVNGCHRMRAPGQGCCGALHAHSGDLRGARRLARRNLEAFEASGADTIVVNAAGCGAFMKGYGELFEGDPVADRAAALAGRVRDATEALQSLGPRAGAPLPVRVAYDAPCHLIHGQGIRTAPTDMLEVVPGLNVHWIDNAAECCGGAGTWGLMNLELGGRILGDKVRSVQAAGADVVATPNPGCMMQIGGGLRAAGDRTPVLHPIELLSASYRKQEENP